MGLFDFFRKKENNKQDGPIQYNEKNEQDTAPDFHEVEVTNIEEPSYHENKMEGIFRENVDVVLTDAGENKIAIIKMVRELNGLHLKEATDFVTNLPYVLKQNVDLLEAEEIRKTFEYAGAKVEFR